MPLDILARLAADFDEGQRSPENFREALEAYRAYLIKKARSFAQLEVPEGSEETWDRVCQCIAMLDGAAETLAEYSRSREPQVREEALRLASQADSDLRDLIWESYDAATRLF